MVKCNVPISCLHFNTFLQNIFDKTCYIESVIQVGDLRSRKILSGSGHCRHWETKELCIWPLSFTLMSQQLPQSVRSSIKQSKGN